ADRSGVRVGERPALRARAQIVVDVAAQRPRVLVAEIELDARTVRRLERSRRLAHVETAKTERREIAHAQQPEELAIGAGIGFRRLERRRKKDEREECG